MLGKIEIESIETETLVYGVGAGETKIEKLTVDKKANIEGGVGKIDILSGEINNLKLDMGVGAATIDCKLVGESDINSGIGETNIDLEDDIENYTIKANKGIGSITINNKQVSNDIEYGNGDNLIKIDGGIGNIKVTSRE